MKNILLPVDGSESSLHAVNYAIDMLKRLPSEHRPVLHILNVQRALSPNFNMLVREEDRVEYYQAEGRKIIGPVESLLKSNNIAHDLHISVGVEPSSTIADFADERGCELIVMGTRGLGSVQGLVLGSVTTKVVHVSRVPVLLVK